MGLFKRFLNPQSKVKDDNTSSNATTPVATPITSPAGSIYEGIISNKYHNDPMRVGKKPDTLGSYFDPMGGHGSYTKGLDVTNTGA
ncbi:hypothetical protein K501DRAFT_200953 [Backusella circina FSU 941]|nr:hypothetical protein K501DRAFT_200953 [Backusella circina FSU 941]